MNNQATTIELFSEKAVDRDATTSKLLKLSILDKTAVVLSTLLSQMIVSIVVALFTLVIKIGPLKCLSGFCYQNTSKAN
jgi:hypothetical protein